MWMLLLILVFINLIMTGILTMVMTNMTLLSVVSIGLTCLLVGAFYGYAFCEGVHFKLRLYSGIMYVMLLVLIALIVAWTPEMFSFSMVLVTLGLVLIYLAEIYFFLQAGALAAKRIIHGPGCNTCDMLHEEVKAPKKTKRTLKKKRK